jgi:membrane-associated phospholipid phosphatase
VSDGQPAQTLLTPIGYAGVGILAVMWLLVALDPHSALNRWGDELLGGSRNTPLGRHARLIAYTGSVVGVVATAAALIGASWRGWWRAFGAITGGFVASYALSDAIKALARRPRPAHELIAAGGSAFPSSDAAISVGFIFVAIVLCRLAGGRIPPWVALSLGAAATLATGLLTIVFRDHTLVEVLAGWGLGAAVFAVATAQARVDRDLAR